MDDIIDNVEYKRACQKLFKKLNHDPWAEFKKYDNAATYGFIKAQPETLQVQYKFDSFSGHLYPLSMLCALGANVNVMEIALEAHLPALVECDVWVGTPLHYACSYKSATTVVEFLIHQHPQALQVTNQFGRLPLHMACLFKAPPQTVSLLLQQYPHGAQVADKDGYTPLHLACENGASPEVVEFLLQAYPNALLAKTSYQSTPLHFACLHNASLAVIETLFQYDRSKTTNTSTTRTTPDTTTINNMEMVEQMDLLGQTPLHMAALSSAPSPEVVALLVATYPEGTKVCTDRGETPYKMAKRKQASPQVLQLLQLPKTATKQPRVGVPVK
jgi:ankyrin repeat protein